MAGGNRLIVSARGLGSAKKCELQVGFGLLQRLVPDEFLDDEAWTDICSERRMYPTQEVEVL